MSLRAYNLNYILSKYTKKEFFAELKILEDYFSGTEYCEKLDNLIMVYKAIFSYEIDLVALNNENPEQAVQHYKCMKTMYAKLPSDFMLFILVLFEYNLTQSFGVEKFKALIVSLF